MRSDPVTGDQRNLISNFLRYVLYYFKGTLHAGIGFSDIEACHHLLNLRPVGFRHNGPVVGIHNGNAEFFGNIKRASEGGDAKTRILIKRNGQIIANILYVCQYGLCNLICIIPIFTRDIRHHETVTIDHLGRHAREHRHAIRSSLFAYSLKSFFCVHLLFLSLLAALLSLPLFERQNITCRPMLIVVT